MKIVLKELKLTNISYLQVAARPSCGQKIIATAADDAIDVNIGQAIRDSCGQLCSNESFMTMGDISMMCCDLCYITYHLK